MMVSQSEGLEEDDPHRPVSGVWIPPPLEHKRSVVCSLLHRVKTIVTTEEDKILETKHVTAALKANGYKDWALKIPQKPLKMPTNTPKKKDQVTPNKSIGMPYVTGLSEHLQRIKHDITVYQFILVHPKDPVQINKKSGVIFKIECEDCQENVHWGHSIVPLARPLKNMPNAPN